MKGFEQTPVKKLHEMTFEDLYIKDVDNWFLELLMRGFRKLLANHQDVLSQRKSHDTYTRA